MNSNAVSIVATLAADIDDCWPSARNSDVNRKLRLRCWRQAHEMCCWPVTTIHPQLISSRPSARWTDCDDPLCRHSTQAPGRDLHKTRSGVDHIHLTANHSLLPQGSGGTVEALGVAVTIYLVLAAGLSVVAFVYAEFFP
jgi:hypothetical protein